jgi:hypothetical protein
VTITPDGVFLATSVEHGFVDALEEVIEAAPEWWERFCSGADPEPLRIHVPTAGGIVMFEIRVTS